MLNPLIHWETGTPVRYHGSLTDLRGGVYHAFPCDCLRCTDHRDLLGVRFALMDGAGDTVAHCVRPRSITPEPEAEQDAADHFECIEPHRDGSGEYVDCDGKPL